MSSQELVLSGGAARVAPFRARFGGGLVVGMRCAGRSTRVCPALGRGARWAPRALLPEQRLPAALR
eukprot:11218305-Lingulodinium_polyedra.AAC.1